ncbi:MULTISPECIES: TonB-dependent receptor [unclassified Sphingomonas]|uniref:TonB-dependent receptor n=1 Tax=unclassified Sphingomonas TaxID=196159 RepID=UPI0009282E92|nr:MULTISPECIES: TonB-dependent receptor [unclassified Sphingomonas]MBN8848748.1 TonB-dependent receptor [Sphingomonas sp.]OJV34343.1 MAG: hypothetical protein BGO24_11610 [Sphingomonas sp. 67-36]
MKGDIVVTARKRTETVQNIPLSIQVVSPDALSKSGSASLLDLASVAPGVNITRAPNESQIGITLRGLGTNAGVPSFDSSVSLFVDGVYAPRSREFSASVFDIQRIEVISGTQAALLGKNTSLGAVNLITRKPGNSLEADGIASYEFEYGSRRLSAGVDLPLSDTLKVRVSGLTEKSAGWVRNIIIDKDATQSDNDSIRAVVVWQPTSKIDVTGVAQHFFGKNYGTPAEFVQTDGTPEMLAAFAGYPGVIETKLDRVSESSTPFSGGEQKERLRVDKYTLTANIGLGEHTLTSITGYSDYADTALADIDYLPSDFARERMDESGHQFSQEIRLVSPSGQRLEYLFGGLYLRGTLNNTTVYTANYPFEPVPGSPFAGSEATDFYQVTTDYSGFGQVSYRITDRLKATASARFTHEEKDVDLGRRVLVPGFFSLAVFPPYAPFSMARSESNFDYSAGLEYQITPNALVYASYGKGTKGGGFAQSVTELDKAEYGKEISRTSEVGVKLSDPARKWVFNLSAFNTNVDGFQVVSFTGIQFIVVNTDLRSRGFELASYWYPVPWLRLFLNNTYADAKDRHTGAPIPLAPKWTGTGGFNVDTSLSPALRFKLDGSIDWRSKRYYQQDPATSPPGKSFVTYNLGVALADQSDKYELRLIGRNLTNANSIAFAFPTPFLPAGNQNAISERGRTIALQLSVKY